MYPIHENFSTVRKEPTSQHFQKSRFAGPIVPDNGNQFPFFYFKTGWEKPSFFIINFCKIMNLNYHDIYYHLFY